MTATPTRSTSAVWRPGDPEGDRRFAPVGDLQLERGGVLPDVTVAYETWGTLSPSGDNAVLVEHALTLLLADGDLIRCVVVVRLCHSVFPMSLVDRWPISG